MAPINTNSLFNPQQEEYLQCFSASMEQKSVFADGIKLLRKGRGEK
jgi:hypothetical protein